MTNQLIVRDLGRQPYATVWQAMRAFTDARGPETADEVWLVEHEPVYTQGQAGRPEHVLAPGDIPVVQTDRGGQVTYHGPGQAVIYPLLDLERLGLGIRSLVHTLEQTAIDYLAARGISGERREGAPGVFVAGAKVASIGMKVRRACTYHGMAFNVKLDLEPFFRINPCGFAGLAMTRLADLVGGPVPEPADAGRELAEALARRLGLEACDGPAEPAFHPAAARLE